jgi:hypothetical protein
LRIDGVGCTVSSHARTVSNPRTMTHLRLRPCTLALLATLAASASCSFSRPQLGQLPGAERDSIRVNPSRATTGAREVMEKKVRFKRGSNTLVATDDSWCTVGDEEYARVRIGESVRCGWVAAVAP